MRGAFILVFVTLVFIVNHAGAAETHITALPYDITSPGYYVLDTGCTNVGWDYAINIASSDVVLDGNGYVLDGSNSYGTYGIIVMNVDNVTLQNVEVTDWDYGIHWRDVEGGMVTDCIFNSNRMGIYIYSSENNTFTNNTALSNIIYGMYLHDSSNNTLLNNNVSNNVFGICLTLSVNNYLTDNTVQSSHNYGIYLIHSASNNTLLNNTLLDNAVGIYLYNSSNNNTLQYNNASSNSKGVVMYSSTNNTLLNNTLSSNSNEGIFLVESDNTTLLNNTLSSNNYGGISLSSSSNNTILGNIFYNDGLFVDYDSYNNTILNNIVNDKELVYLEGVDNQTINSTSIGQVIIVKCDGITLRDLNISNTVVAIELVESYNNTLLNNTLLYNMLWGVSLSGSSNNTLLNNDISNNTIGGIWLGGSNSNIITNNTITNNSGGIYLSDSNNNTLLNNNVSNNTMGGMWLEGSNSNIITNNTITNNYQGIYLSECVDNVIYLNDLMNNTQNAMSESYSYGEVEEIEVNVGGLNGDSYNMWNSTSQLKYVYNNTYYTGYLGNYYSDYTGTDADNDGIGDTTYEIAGAIDEDVYPLMQPSIYYIDTVSPVLTIHSPVEGMCYNTSNVELNVSASETVTAFYEIQNGESVSVQLGTDSSFIQLLNLTDGNYTLTVYAEDGAGWTTEGSVNFSVDTVSPVLTIHSPLEDAIYSAPMLMVNVSEPSTIFYNIDGGNNSTPVLGTFLHETLISPDGGHTLTVYAYDRAGNIGVAIVNFTSDTAPPTITITSPIEGGEYITSPISLMVTVSENSTLWYSLDYGNNSTTITGTTLNASIDVKPGIHTVCVYAQDEAGNLGFEEVSFTLLSPTPTGISPAQEELLVEILGEGEGSSQAPPAETEVMVPEVTPEEPTTITIEEEAPELAEELIISELTLDVNVVAEDVEIVIEQNPEPPVEVPDVLVSIGVEEAAVFGYISISTSLPEGAVEQAEVTFKIPKSWYEENELDPTTTQLTHYNEETGEWELLSTQTVGEDEEYYYFSSITPGFSVFSVIATKITIIATEVTEEAITVEVTGVIVEETAPPAKEEKAPGFECALAMAGLLTTLLLLRRVERR